MTRKISWISLLFIVTLLLSGCAVRAVDEMYCLPKRTEAYKNFQSVMDSAMGKMEYCAPITGEHQQTVQMADLDGDYQQEYLVFARTSAERPLRILIFDQQGDAFVHTDTIECSGTAFEQVEYVQMDHRAGVELVVGRQLSDQVLRSVSVYTFAEGAAEKLLSTNYSRFLTVDLDEDQLQELFILRPGQSDEAQGVATLYGIDNGSMERSLEVNLSVPAGNLKRIITGKLQGGKTAVFAAGTVEDTSLLTDVYAVLDGTLTNVSASNESGTSVGTMRNHYIYADDIDNDGIVELPSLIPMAVMYQQGPSELQEIIRWYAMAPDGSEQDKLYTYHNFVDGWYLILDSQWAQQMRVEQNGYHYSFYLWNEASDQADKVLMIDMLTGEAREEKALQNGSFTLHRADSVVYTATLTPESVQYGITKDWVEQNFRMIYLDWKTGET